MPRAPWWYLFWNFMWVHGSHFNTYGYKEPGSAKSGCYIFPKLNISKTEIRSEV